MPHTPQTAFVRLLQSVTDARNIAPGDRIEVTPHVVILGPRDGLAALKAFRLAGGETVVDPERFILFSDDNLPAPDAASANQRKQLHEAAKQAGLSLIPGAGCELATVIEEALVVPGELAVSNLPEVSLLGGIGAGGVRVTVRDIAALMAGDKLQLTVPEAVRANLAGQRQEFVGGRDVFWYLLRELDRERIVGRVVEVGGAGLASMDLHERMALASQCGHAGPLAVFCVPDRAGVQELNRHIKRPYATVEPEKAAGYAHSADVDVAHAQLSLVPAGGPDEWRTAGEASGDPVKHVVLSGLSLTGIRVAGEIIKQRRLNPGVRCELVPASRADYARAVEEDWIGHLLDADVKVHPPGTRVGSLAREGSLLTSLVAPRGCARTGVVEAATAACAGAIIHPERLDALPQRDSKLSGRRKPV